jgi:hypothetical protein
MLLWSGLAVERQNGCFPSSKKKPSERIQGVSIVIPFDGHFLARLVVDVDLLLALLFQ